MLGWLNLRIWDSQDKFVVAYSNTHMRKNTYTVLVR
jgi:hypothetical protein